jgi:hypothetical protein
VYEDVHDAKNALEKLSGFNVLGRYIVVIYWQPTHGKDAGDKAKKAGGGGSNQHAVSAQTQREEVARKKIELEQTKAKFGVKGMEE